MRRLAVAMMLAALAWPDTASAAWSWPVKGRVVTQFSHDGSRYGAGLHRGIDIEADPGAALEWYAQLREPLRERLRQAMVGKLAAVDPARASEWLARDESAQLGASDLLPVLRGLELKDFEQQFGWARSPARE